MTQQLTASKASSLMLLHHGTQPSRLSVGAVIQTAKSDLERREANRELRRLRKNGMASKDTGTLHQCCFIAKHLEGCSTPAEVLKKAIDDPTKGIAASDVNRARIYRDAELLKEALKTLDTTVTPSGA